MSSPTLIQTLGAILFAIGVVGIFLNRKNIIVLLMAIELMLLAVNMNFIAFSHWLDDVSNRPPLVYHHIHHIAATCARW